METRDLKDLVEFSPQTVRTRAVLESERLWSELVCLERNQQFGPVVDHDSDAIFAVVAGEVVVQVGRRRKRLGQWGAVLVPAASRVVVTNASGDPAVVLVVAAPPPTPRQVTG